MIAHFQNCSFVLIMASTSKSSVASTSGPSQHAMIAKSTPIRLTLKERYQHFIPLHEMDPTECCASPSCKFCVESKQAVLPPPAKKAKVTSSPEKENCYWDAIPLPTEITFTILNNAARSKANDRLKSGWDLVHHALQPCSVCGQLLAIKVDDAGEIITSGKCFVSPFYYL